MSGSRGVRWPSRNRLDQEVTRAAATAQESLFGTHLNERFARLLGEFNNRDTEKVRQRLDDIRECLQSDAQGTMEMLFGGSVAKHTYVDGLSDIDTLIVLTGTSLESDPPARVLSRLKTLVKSCSNVVSSDSGTIALTVRYRDGMEIQCLPALRTRSGIRIPSALDSSKWADINPEKFAQTLSKTNAELGGKLVPVIKLAKAAINSMPPQKQISGYHVEALGIATFRGYRDDLVPSKMLPHFFDTASRLVLGPISDSTGQSIHVDDALGPANSAARQEVSIAFQRLSKKMRNATAAQDLDQWDELFQ
jgi:SMODS domain-containing protein